MSAVRRTFLYDVNLTLENYLNEHNVPHKFHESSGTHDFDFWNQYIQKSFAWAVEETIV